MTLGERTRAHLNAFDVLRLAAAFLVFWSHCFMLTGGDDPLLSRAGIAASEVGLMMFFAMSGFLVTRSWLSDPNWRAYARKRALRLMPGLIVVVTLTAFVLGPLVTSFSLVAYFTDPQTYFYVVRNSLLLTPRANLPGVFTDNVFAFPNAVNGSLWTLPVEAGAYVAIALAASLFAGVRARYAAVVIGVGLVLLSPMVNLEVRIPVGTDGRFLPTIAELYVAFAVGALMWLERERLSLRWRYVALCVGALALLRTSVWNDAAYALTIPYLTIFAAFRLPAAVRKLTDRTGDLSYGIYITAYPLQQTVAHVYGPSLGAWTMMVLAAPLIFLAAALSWHYVEKPALARKYRSVPAPAPAGDVLAASAGGRRQPFRRYRPQHAPHVADLVPPAVEVSAVGAGDDVE